jgi:hypothetical protein
MSLCQSLRQYVFVHAAIVEGAVMVVDEERKLASAKARAEVLEEQPARKDEDGDVLMSTVDVVAVRRSSTTSLSSGKRFASFRRTASELLAWTGSHFHP